ncbi:unnamed protein product [Wuchereria bancrofti]|uniref:protein-histidine N-methyltransferase n=1 Tax=Wuchereria bancrofti TaxID=6293 RepID=A0A3P7DU94_WUCBA|nr:unnamed protein product [Wuchereria bancrofti]
MSSNNGSFGGSSSCEGFDVSQYRKFLNELQRRASELWEITLCHTPTSNTVELLREHMVIRESLLEIGIMQKKFSRKSETDLTYSERRKVALADFLQWANMVGISHCFVEIAYDEDVDGFVMLCCQKLVPESHWQPYIKVLPENFNTPLFFTVEQLQFLRPSPLFEESLLLYRNVSRQFIHFLLEIIRSDQFRHRKKKSKEMSKLEPIYVNSPLTAANFTFNLYRWSVACISTRINMIPSEVLRDDIGQPRLIPGLIPFLDMANHSYIEGAFHESVHFSVEFDCAEIIAVRDYKPLEPVNIFYGWRSNRDFLLHNGFVPSEKNIRDIYKLKIGLPKSKREVARMHLFYALGFLAESTIFAFEINISKPYFHDLLFRFAQIYVLDEVFSTAEQVEEALNSSDNIRKAWNFLHDRFALLLRAYDRVIDPVKVTHPEPSEFSRYNAIRKSMIERLKLSEIEILQKVKDFCNEQLLGTA